MVISTSRHVIFQFSNSHELIRGSFACGIMFVTNWLTWNTEMMQANCSTPSRSMTGSVFTFFLLLFVLPFSISGHCIVGSGTANKAWEIASQVQSALIWRLFTSQQACGAQHPAVPCTAIHLPCHVKSCGPSLRSLVKREGFQPLALYGLVMFLPVGRCGLENGNIVTPTLHASSPPHASGYQGG